MKDRVRGKASSGAALLLLSALALALAQPGAGRCGEAAGGASGAGVPNTDTPERPAWTSRAYEKVKSATQWGGHYKLRGRGAFPSSDSVIALVDDDPAADGYTELRRNGKLFLGGWGRVVCQNQLILFGGQLTDRADQLLRMNPGFGSLGALSYAPISDDASLMDLNWMIERDDGFSFYNRIDRLYFGWTPNWGFVRVGRQAVSWGNGLLFNPMDLANPFRPTNIDRDYKVGDDMVVGELSIDEINGNAQLIYVPRRDPRNKHMEWWDQSTLAGKLHFGVKNTGFDIMGAANYEDPVIGLGSTGYLKGAGWRVNATYTFLEGEEAKTQDGYLSVVANMDYYWVWFGKNFYGFVEYYYNGLGESDYPKAFSNTALIEGLERGYIFTVGRHYLSGNLQVELTPALTVYVTAINNILDPSGILQPRAIWSATQSLQLTLGGTVYYGGAGTEYGGIEIPGTTSLLALPQNAFLWLTWFF